MHSFRPVSQIRDPISRIDASVSWLCHFGERPFSLCLCLGCCVSRVFNTSFFVAVSPCQETGTGLSGRQCLATGAAANAMNSGTGLKAPSLLSMLTREAHWGIGLKRYRTIFISTCQACIAGKGRLPKKTPHKSHTPGGTRGTHGLWVRPGINPHGAWAP